MKHALDRLWQNDVALETAEHQELQRYTAQFTSDIHSALLDAVEENTRSAYASHNDPQRESIAYFDQLVERTFSALPTHIREDAFDFSTVLRSCSGMLRPEFAKSVFSAVPNALLAYPAVLDACADLCEEPISLFCGLSPEKQHDISRDWFETFWNQQMIDADDARLHVLLPEELPWSILRTVQVQHALEHMPKHTLRDFSRIPHEARSIALWQQDFRHVFRQALALHSPEVLHALSCWPEQYRAPLHYDLRDLQQYIEGSGFSTASCAPLFAITGETPRTVGLHDQASTTIHRILNSPVLNRRIFVIVNDLFPYLSPHEQSRIERYLQIIEKGKFHAFDAHVVYTCWSAGEQEHASDDDIIAAARQDLVRDIAQSVPEHETEIYDVFRAYSSHTQNVPRAESLLWEALAQIQESSEDQDDDAQTYDRAQPQARVVFLQNIHRFLQFANNNDPDVLLAVMEFAQSDTAIRVVNHVIESLNDVSAQECIEAIRQHGTSGVLTHYFAQIRKTSGADRGPIRHFGHAMQRVRLLRDTRRSLQGKGMSGYAEARADLEAQIHEALHDIRQARDQEHTYICAIADAVRAAMDQSSADSVHDATQALRAALAPLLDALSEETRNNTWSKVQTYIAKRHAVKEFAVRYRHNAHDLFTRVLPRHEALHGDVEIITYGMSLAFALDERDYSSDKSNGGSGAYATDASNIYALRGTIVVMAKANGPFAHEIDREKLVHENRHQEDRLFFAYTQPLETAKTEILAFLSEGLSPDAIYEILADRQGIYTFSIPQGPAWTLHCKRLRRALNIAEVVQNLDLLAQKPIQQWRQLLSHPSAA